MGSSSSLIVEEEVEVEVEVEVEAGHNELLVQSIQCAKLVNQSKH